jgi:hypothetical protein
MSNTPRGSNAQKRRGRDKGSQCRPCSEQGSTTRKARARADRGATGGLRYNDPVPKTDEKGTHELGGGRGAWFSDPDGTPSRSKKGARHEAHISGRVGGVQGGA